MLLLLPLMLLQVLTIQNAIIVVSDIPASNGIIHVLSKVCQYWEIQSYQRGCVAASVMETTSNVYLGS